MRNNSREIDASSMYKKSDECQTILNEIIQKLEIETLPSALKKINDKKISKSVNFCNVDLYMFNRAQGFECIPSDSDKGTITLGMTKSHGHLEKYATLEDYLLAKRSEHLDILEEEKTKIIQRRQEIGKIINSNNFFKSNPSKVFSPAMLQPDYTDEEANKILNVCKNKEDYEDIDKELPVCTDLFCPILSTEERYAKLIDEGLSESEIDKTESEEILNIQESREITGCDCGKLGLECGDNPDCSCWSNGIGCQIDKQRYPCSCGIKKCKNPNGLKRFDHKSVLLHWQQILRQPQENNADDMMDDSPVKTIVKKKRKRNNFNKYNKQKKRKTK